MSVAHRIGDRALVIPFTPGFHNFSQSFLILVIQILIVAKKSFIQNVVAGSGLRLGHEVVGGHAECIWRSSQLFSADGRGGFLFSSSQI